MKIRKRWQHCVFWLKCRGSQLLIDTRHWPVVISRVIWQPPTDQLVSIAHSIPLSSMLSNIVLILYCY